MECSGLGLSVVLDHLKDLSPLLQCPLLMFQNVKTTYKFIFHLRDVEKDPDNGAEGSFLHSDVFLQQLATCFGGTCLGDFGSSRVKASDFLVLGIYVPSGWKMESSSGEECKL